MPALGPLVVLLGSCLAVELPQALSGSRYRGKLRSVGKVDFSANTSAWVPWRRGKAWPCSGGGEERRGLAVGGSGMGQGELSDQGLDKVVSQGGA